MATWQTPVFVELIPRLAELVGRRRDDIIDRGTDWIRSESTDLQGKRPRHETRELVCRNFEGFYAMIVDADTSTRDQFIEFVTAYRSAMEFKVSTLLQGFMTFKVGVDLCLAEEESDPVEARKLRDIVDAAYFDSCFLVSDVYASKLKARLHQTEAELMRREKQAALGRLVAGVAHEINTPIGVAVTGTSFVRDRVAEVEETFRNGKLRKSGMTRFFDEVRQAADLSLTNLQRAADLVRSFKQVAVDQSSELKRRVNLGQYVGDVLASLQPLYRRTSVRVRQEVEAKVVMMVVPGAISQIVTNLVSNAITHGFDPGQAGEIVINVSLESDKMAVIECRDNGRGMSPEVRDKVFEPFFTTRRGSGGSGLGLHIVHNIVTDLLGGEVSVASEPHEGCRVCIRVPIMSPGRPVEHPGG